MNGTHRLKSIRLFLIILTLSIGGCTGFKSNLVVDSSKLASASITEAANQNSDFEMVRDGLPGGLLQMDGFIKMAPDDKELLLSAAESNSGYAFLFVQDENKPRAAKLFKKAKEYAFRVLKQNPAFNDACDQTRDEFVEALKTFDKEDVPALYLGMNSWLSYIGLANAEDPSLLMDLPKVEAMMDRIRELDETYKYGAVHAVMGTYHAAKPEIFGGKPQEAKKHFDKAFEISGRKFLIWHLLFAKFYTVQVQDQDLFVETLEEVIEAPENLLPEQNFANEAARHKAKALLEKADTLF
ncbi:MAG: TRAP transporter TatT component family protein [Desulfobacterales bacterium]